ncbi:MAG: AMP-binding protein [Nitratireductor sp.]
MPVIARVEQFLRRSAGARADKAAIVDADTRLSYAELDAAADRLAAGLAARGVKSGDRVVVLMDNIWEAPLSIFAVLRAGAVFCPVNPAASADMLAQIFGDCAPRVVLTQAKYARAATVAAAGLAAPPLIVAARAVAALPPGVAGFETLLKEEAPAKCAPDGAASDLAMIIYTSGSTGRPKGVMIAHTAMIAVSGSIAAYLDNGPDDVVLAVLPLSFTYGLYQLIVAARVGATLVLEKSFAFPHDVLARARAEGVTGLPLVPTMAAMILGLSELKPGALPALRYITNAAAALPPAHVAGLRRLFPGVRIYSMYGLTECARASFLPARELERRPDSVGRAIPGTETAIVDEAGRPVPAGTVGELVVRGPHLMRGYWGDEEATARALRPAPAPGARQLHTGDLFRADADGFLYFVGRKDDIIKIRGEKVAPKRVETVLHACAGVREALVFGVPDPVLGHVLHAVVVRADPDLDDRAILRHCARNLPDLMVPRKIEFRQALPKTASGKVVRRLVLETGTDR